MLTEKQLAAARLCGSRHLTNKQVALEVGISVRTLCHWKTIPEFQVMADKAAIAWREKAKKLGIGDADRRLFHLNDRWRRLQSLIRQRARSEAMKGVPGGDTGLIMIRQKSLRIDKETSQIVEEYAVDTGLLAALLAMEHSAAVELGQMQKRIQVDATLQLETSPEAVALAKLLSVEQLEQLRDRLREQQAQIPGGQ